jgi:glycosyltransferase involved in cell wall biosynthesis
MLDRTGMRGRILLAGHRFDIPRVLAALDILVSCSYSEAFSNTIVEAMSCSVPCVVTDTGDSVALVGNAGKIVSIGSAGAVAGACLDLLALSPTDRSELGRAARARIVANFSLGTAADRFAAEYRGLVARS